MKRITVSIPEDIYELLEQWGSTEDRSIPNLVAHLARKGALQWKEQQEQQPKAS